MLNVIDCIITNLFEKLLYDIKSIQLIFLSFFVFFNLCKMKDRIWNLHNKVYISILKWNIILHSPNNIKRFFYFYLSSEKGYIVFLIFYK